MYLQHCTVSVTFVIFLDDSDDPTGKMDHLPRRILSAMGQRKKKMVKRKGKVNMGAETEDEEEAEPANSRADWSRKDPAKVGSRVRDWVKPTADEAAGDSLAELTSAYDFYKLFQSDSYVEQVNISG